MYPPFCFHLQPSEPTQVQPTARVLIYAPTSVHSHISSHANKQPKVILLLSKCDFTVCFPPAAAVTQPIHLSIMQHCSKDTTVTGRANSALQGVEGMAGCADNSMGEWGREKKQTLNVFQKSKKMESKRGKKGEEEKQKASSYPLVASPLCSLLQRYHKCATKKLLHLCSSSVILLFIVGLSHFLPHDIQLTSQIWD